MTQSYVSSELTVDEIDVAASALASILMPLTDAVLVKQRIRYLWVPDEPVTASGGAPITRTGSFFFQTGEDTPIALIVARAIKDDILMDSGPGEGIIIDTSNSDVETFVSAVVDGIVTNVFGNDTIELASAYTQSRV